MDDCIDCGGEAPPAEEISELLLTGGDNERGECWSSHCCKKGSAWAYECL